MPWSFEVVAGPFGFTEGPAWDGEALFFSDIPSSRLLRWDPAGGETTVWREDTQVETPPCTFTCRESRPAPQL